MKSRYTLRIEKEVLQEMKIEAIKKNIPLNEFIVQIYFFYKEHFHLNCD